MARLKIIGTEKCPHPNREGKTCNKEGRYNPKPVISWNNKRKFDMKREYLQFIHNDGTTHNLGPYKDYRLSQMKDNPLEHTFKLFTEASEKGQRTVNHLQKYVERDLRGLKPTEDEIHDLEKGSDYFNTIVDLTIRGIELLNISIKYILQKGQKPPEEIMAQLKHITRTLQGYIILEDHGINPFYSAMIQMYDKYVLPKRIEAKKDRIKKLKEWPIHTKNFREGIM